MMNVHNEPRCFDENTCLTRKPHYHGFGCNACEECEDYCHYSCPQNIEEVSDVELLDLTSNGKVVGDALVTESGELIDLYIESENLVSFLKGKLKSLRAGSSHV